jgi:hypothetical protein
MPPIIPSDVSLYSLADQLSARLEADDPLTAAEQRDLLGVLLVLADEAKRRDEILNGQTSAEVIRMRRPRSLALVQLEEQTNV